MIRFLTLGSNMNCEEIQTLLKSNFTDSQIDVTGDGRHFEALIVSHDFEGLNLLARQRLVYKTLNDYIRDGRIHALSIKAKTPSEWQQENN